jgi:WD40 repeat protein
MLWWWTGNLPYQSVVATLRGIGDVCADGSRPAGILSRDAPDGTAIVLGARNGTVRLHDLATGEELRRDEIMRGEVHSLAFSPDGEFIAAAGQQTAARLHCAASLPIMPAFVTGFSF